MAITCTLGSLDITSYLVGDGIDIGTPVREWDSAGGTGVDIATQVNVRTNQLVPMTLRLNVKGTSADDLISKLDAIRDEVVKDSNTLTLKPTDATNSVSATIVKNPHVAVPWDNIYDVGDRAIFDLVLYREPWLYGSEVTSLNASAQTFPDGLTFKASSGDASTLAGDAPAPLTITVVPDTAEGNVHAVWCGWSSDSTWTGYKVETDTAGDWSGGTVAAGPTTNASGGASVKNSSTGLATLTIDTSAFPADRYLVIVRASMEDAAYDGYFCLGTSGTAAITDVTTFDPAGTDWEHIEIGVVNLPVRPVRSGTASNLYLWMWAESGTAGRAPCCDYIAFVPIGHGLSGWHNLDAYADNSASIVMANTGTYDAGLGDAENALGSGIYAVGLGTLIVVAEEVTPNDSHYHGKITVKHTPRYHQWR